MKLSKQEEIREHLIELFEQTPAGEPPDKLADAVLWVLNEDGVVIKVERVHDSDCSTHNEPAYPAGECDCRVLPAGCAAVEPLVEDVHIQE